MQRLVGCNHSQACYFAGGARRTASHGELHPCLTRILGWGWRPETSDSGSSLCSGFGTEKSGLRCRVGWFGLISCSFYGNLRICIGNEGESEREREVAKEKRFEIAEPASAGQLFYEQWFCSFFQLLVMVQHKLMLTLVSLTVFLSFCSTPPHRLIGLLRGMFCRSMVYHFYSDIWLAITDDCQYIR